MKKLAIYIPSIESGGVEKNLFYISNYLAKKNIVVYIVTANKNKKNFFNNKVKIICPKSSRWNNSSRIIKTLICLSLIISKLPLKDISILSFQSNVSAIILSKLFKLKIIVRLNTSTKKYINNFIKNLFFKKIYSMSDVIIVNSLEFKKDLKKILNVDSIQIYNPIKFKNINKKLKIDYFKNFRGIKILSIGRLTDQKDQLTLLKSMTLILKKSSINFKLVIIGKGKNQTILNRYINENNLTKNVYLLGYKKNAFSYLSLFDLFILSSKYEGLPNTLLEAQMSKIPIISSDCPTGPKEILLGGKLGILFKTGDHIDLYKKLLLFIKNKKKYKQKATLAKKYLNRFDYKKNLKRYLKIINKYI